jgi:hypothetical protein
MSALRDWLSRVPRLRLLSLHLIFGSLPSLADHPHLEAFIGSNLTLPRLDFSANPALRQLTLTRIYQCREVSGLDSVTSVTLSQMFSLTRLTPDPRTNPAVQCTLSNTRLPPV